MRDRNEEDHRAANGGPMVALVRTALAKPLSYVVLAIVIATAGLLSIARTPIDIFPRIGVPVVGVAWTYNNLPPREMAARVITPFERVLTNTVDDIERIESQALSGVGVTKIYFHEGVDINRATAQVTSISQTILRQMPPGMTPPMVVNYDASTVPIMQLALSGEGLSEGQLFDLGLNQIRPQLITVPGVAMPFPSGGRQRQMVIDIDPQKLAARGLSAADVAAALSDQTQIAPVGFAKIGGLQYVVALNNAPSSVAQIAAIPISAAGGASVLMRDVATVRDGAAPQVNAVHVDGQRSVLMTVLKSGGASTLDIVEGVRARLPQAVAGLPDALNVDVVGDQSQLVKAAVSSVVLQGVLAAIFTSLMILLFLGSWRSTIIIIISIPLSILGAIVGLSLAGHTLNIMTLSGLALAIGILVDDATVTVENINWHLDQGKPVTRAILDGAAQIVTPVFVALLSICIVFVPMFFLPGVAGYLFVPMALAVIFAMVTSFILSRTLVPAMAQWMIPRRDDERLTRAGRFARCHRGFEQRFEEFRDGYVVRLRRVFAGRRAFVPLFMGFAVLSLALTPFLGRDFFPQVDSGQIALHVRAPAGTQIEETSRRFADVQAEIRRLLPEGEIDTMADNIGLSFAPLNNIYANSGTVGPNEGDVLITLADGHSPTKDHVSTLRRELPLLFPGMQFSFLPPDMIGQILNFGSPAPIDVQVRGRDIPANMQYAQKLLKELRTIPGLADARIQQSVRYPQIDVEVDRQRLAGLGLDQRDVTASLGTALAGTTQTQPTFYLDPETGVSYPVVAQMPERSVASMADLRALPVAGGPNADAQTLGGIGTVSRGNTISVVNKYDILPTINIYGSVQGRDLGAVAADVNAAIDRFSAEQPEGATVTVRGQFETMNTAFTFLAFGLVAAVVLIYLVLVVNFQSWIDPLVIIGALPAALAGIVWTLFVTGTTLSVPALTGAIMVMGIATANATLVVSFARERLAETGDAWGAARDAGMLRLRPVLMTALTMIIGMLPMALGVGDGSEQNVPLGRAVVGGLTFATIATLFFVPTLFGLAHARRAKSVSSSATQPTLPEPIHV